MKKLILFLVILFSFSFNLNAQNAKSNWKSEAGFFFAPQAYFDVNDLNAGSTFIYPLYTGLSFTKGKWNLMPNYNLTYNGYGVVVSYFTSKTITNYFVIAKNVKDRNGYVGTGINFPFSNSAVVGILEIGTPVFGATKTPQLYLGIGIPAFFDLKKKK